MLSRLNEAYWAFCLPCMVSFQASFKSKFSEVSEVSLLPRFSEVLSVEDRCALICTPKLSL